MIIRSNRTLVISMLLTVVVLSGCAATVIPGHGTALVSASGTFQLAMYGSDYDPTNPYEEGNYNSDGSTCSGQDGYSDIDQGVIVKIESATTDQVLNTGELGPGTDDGAYCTFTFTVDNLPPLPQYLVEVGRRGQINEDLADMSDISLSLGGD